MCWYKLYFTMYISCHASRFPKFIDFRWVLNEIACISLSNLTVECKFIKSLFFNELIATYAGYNNKCNQIWNKRMEITHCKRKISCHAEYLIHHITPSRISNSAFKTIVYDLKITSWYDIAALCCRVQSIDENIWK